MQPPMTSSVTKLQNNLFADAPTYQKKKPEIGSRQTNQQSLNYQEEEQKVRVDNTEMRKNALAQEALKTLYQTNEMAAETNQNISSQGQQLTNINDKLNDNQNKLGKIEYIQKNLKSGWGQFKGLFSSPKTVNVEKDQQKFNQQQQDSQVQVQIQNEPQKQKHDVRNLSAEEVVGLKGQLTKEERDQMLEEINNQILLLKNQHVNLNMALKQQDHQLDHIQKKTDKQTNQMQKVEVNAQKLLNKK